VLVRVAKHPRVRKIDFVRIGLWEARMNPNEFGKFGHEVIDWIAGYMRNPSQYSVLSRVRPGEIAEALPSSGPQSGEPMSDILLDFERHILPGITHWGHPGFMAYFANTASGAGILGELLAAALNANGMLWKTSPAVTELEQVVLGWLRKWMGLPEGFFGLIYDTASISSMHAIAAARELADPEARVRGARPGLVLYASEQAHSSIEKAAIALGIGQRNVRKIPVDPAFRMRPDALEESIRRDLELGLRPFCVVATVGTTSTTSVDPVPQIATIAAKYDLWLHVDAAYAGSAAIAEEFRWSLAGCERADSLVTNPHKWLCTPIDLSALYTRRPEILRRAFSLVPEYLRTDEENQVINLMDYGVPLGRRFRALKLWFVMRYYGRDALANTIRAQINWARELATLVDSDPNFERCAPTPFSVVCFRAVGSDAINRAILNSVNASGEIYLSHTVLNEKYVLRLAIGNMGTTRGHVLKAWGAIRAAREKIPPSIN
jgi:aromatic-L-amino-acid/L-tryptophan decarboxylase